ncbi:phage integrase : Phage integrase OS=Methylomicrobium alcaliphilum (strain DSM 19304 / NCIMB 14124 / VKM B-2133 / 20Z) GN=MEALZ_p0088 PE=4 SV=1: Phage_int_SAM_1: Phage_integrase [Gemmata massiliana]|uniref:Tyr recombinase domain-containing protein n=1 Tax=Gemmata massiliana TaxID=1210884 RepID=A0A6P2D1R4_9BACT|nr:tyrosine-type recombinase/integrase [Gemmata massiliana]VTR93362.1 phage integrase : Phage integrase OS=Methylomicrobium alcaliphilum (strain DSM 19304 / NCIMB 14124 / VKM B-2133 / 20Z) GN=MEALZ_p0088 PE=4 SV=1: Phage_int_SAM_1: Phage_integrase [Gemmata massiliana]
MTQPPALPLNPGSLPIVNDLRSQLTEAVEAWRSRSPSAETRSGYTRDLNQFLRHVGIAEGAWDELPRIRPGHVSAWRDHLLAAGQTNTSIGRKLSVIRSLFGYLRAYGYARANPADTTFVAAPPVPRDGKTVGLEPEECRLLLDAPLSNTPEGVRDRALLAVFAFTGCRVGEVCRLRVEDYKASGGHKVLEVRGKGGKERRVALHPEAFERLDAWLDAGMLRGASGALFRPVRAARGHGAHGFRGEPLSRRAVQLLVERYVKRLKLDPNVTVHSFRVTALTTARERGADIIDLQDFAGHADPRTTLGYIRNRDRLSRSPAYVLKY